MLAVQRRRRPPAVYCFGWRYRTPSLAMGYASFPESCGINGRSVLRVISPAALLAASATAWYDLMSCCGADEQLHCLDTNQILVMLSSDSILRWFLGTGVYVLDAVGSTLSLQAELSRLLRCLGTRALSGGCSHAVLICLHMACTIMYWMEDCAVGRRDRAGHAWLRVLLVCGGSGVATAHAHLFEFQCWERFRHGAWIHRACLCRAEYCTGVFECMWTVCVALIGVEACSRRTLSSRRTSNPVQG